MNRPNRGSLGRNGEDMAAEYLTNAGWQILCRNFRAGHGEIDIIALDSGTLVFVEVKTSRSQAFGPPETWINRKKQNVIARTAEAYLQVHDIQEQDCRFDAIIVNITPAGKTIKHIHDAFWLA